MKAIVGLFRSEPAVYPAVERLKDAGIAETRIHIYSDPRSISKLLGCDSGCVIRKYLVWGAAIGIGIYAISGLVAAMCQCNFMHYGQEFGIFTLLGALLAGTFIGGFIGVLVGAGEAESETHRYVQGVRLGGRVISIQVSKEDVERVKQILVEENILGLKTVQPEQVGILQ